MKTKKIKYMLVWVLGILTLTGCNSYLEVNPQGVVEQEKQFEDIQGYRDAMYGIYASMAKTDLYGKAMSWGFMDQVAQLFYEKYANEGRPEVAAANNYLYTDVSLLTKVENIWAKSYECISYVNNVLENIESVNLDEDSDYSLIKGEAYAIRAFLHFDVMRMYAENILLQPEAGGIPYSYTFDLNNKKVYTLKESYRNVLQDLKAAEVLLVEDNEIDPEQYASEYRKTRWMHCNKYAVWALQARVFHYKGDLDSAAFYAEKVIASSKFNLVSKGTYLSGGVKRYPTYKNSELIWGLYTSGLYDSYNNLFLKGSIGSGYALPVREDVATIYEKSSFDADSEDQRFEAFFKIDESAYPYPYKFIRLLNVEEKATYLQGVCLIRLPEMFYILAEATYNKDKTKAVRYFNDVRNSRGLKDIDDSRVDSWEKFKQELVIERCKEFWGEGQTFFSYKRENMSIKSGTSAVIFQPSSAIYVLPWPQKEQEFGETNK